MVGINMDSNSIDGIKLSFNIKSSAKIEKLNGEKVNGQVILELNLMDIKKSS